MKHKKGIVIVIVVLVSIAYILWFQVPRGKITEEQAIEISKSSGFVQQLLENHPNARVTETSHLIADIGGQWYITWTWSGIHDFELIEIENQFWLGDNLYSSVRVRIDNDVSTIIILDPENKISVENSIIETIEAYVTIDDSTGEVTQERKLESWLVGDTYI